MNEIKLILAVPDTSKIEELVQYQRETLGAIGINESNVLAVPGTTSFDGRHLAYVETDGGVSFNTIIALMVGMASEEGWEILAAQTKHNQTQKDPETGDVLYVEFGEDAMRPDRRPDVYIPLSKAKVANYMEMDAQGNTLPITPETMCVVPCSDYAEWMVVD